MTTMPPLPMSPPPSMAPPSMPGGAMRRPTGVTILAVLAFIGAAFLVLGGLFLMTMGSAISAIADQPGGELFAMFGAAFGVLAIVLGLLYAAVGWGYWKGLSWSWWLGFILSAIGAVFAVFSLVTGDFSSIISLAIQGFLLWYLAQRGVQRWFKVSVNLPWAK